MNGFIECSWLHIAAMFRVDHSYVTVDTPSCSLLPSCAQRQGGNIEGVVGPWQLLLLVQVLTSGEGHRSCEQKKSSISVPVWPRARTSTSWMWRSVATSFISNSMELRPCTATLPGCCMNSAWQQNVTCDSASLGTCEALSISAG